LCDDAKNLPTYEYDAITSSKLHALRVGMSHRRWANFLWIRPVGPLDGKARCMGKVLPASFTSTRNPSLAAGSYIRRCPDHAPISSGLHSMTIVGLNYGLPCPGS